MDGCTRGWEREHEDAVFARPPFSLYLTELHYMYWERHVFALQSYVFALKCRVFALLHYATLFLILNMYYKSLLSNAKNLYVK